MIINSLLDNDTYKFAMCQAISHQYPHIDVEYRFINRGKHQFPPGFARRLQDEVNSMAELQLTNEECDFLREKCYYLKPNYLEWLMGYRYNPGQVQITQNDGTLHVLIRGPWRLTVLWEVPLMAIISELYFKMTMSEEDHRSVSDAYHIRSVADNKFSRMSLAGVDMSEFGTRRRFSSDVQSLVTLSLSQHACCLGTSNMHLAKELGLTPIGTVAHEWFMAHAAMFGYRMATRIALDTWVKEYQGDLGIALPDTFTTNIFLRDFDTFYAKLFDGVRWDSGSWKEFTDKIIAHYKKLRIDPGTKTIVYSDSLDVDAVIKIHNYVDGRIRDVYGIGTHLTNHMSIPGTKVTPLNMVIKMVEWDGMPTLKLSDSPGKVLGTEDEVAYCKRSLGV